MPFLVSPWRALMPCVLATLMHAAAHAAGVNPVVAAAAPDAPAAPTQYQPSTAYKPLAALATTPDRAWKEQNRIVAAQDGMAPAMAGHGHAHGATVADPHAGHSMQHAPAADPHASHAMPAAVDPHAAHSGHARHRQAPPADAPPPAAAAPAHQHEGHH